MTIQAKNPDHAYQMAMGPWFDLEQSVQSRACQSVTAPESSTKHRYTERAAESVRVKMSAIGYSENARGDIYNLSLLPDVIVRVRADVGKWIKNDVLYPQW